MAPSKRRKRRKNSKKKIFISVLTTPSNARAKLGGLILGPQIRKRRNKRRRKNRAGGRR